MGTQRPRLEARISAQERMQMMLHSRVEELSEDMLSSFKQQLAEQAQFEKNVDARFDQVDFRLNKIEVTMATKEDIATLKEDITVLETRVLDAFQQLLAVIDQRFPPLEK